MATPELDNLLVDHLADFDSAAVRLAALETEIFGEIDAVTEAWAQEKGWLGHYDFAGIRPLPRATHPGLWFAPPEWRTPGTDTQEFQAWFKLVPGSDQMDYFELTALCGKGSGRFGFALEISTDVIQWKHWKMLFKDPTFTGLIENTAFTVDSIPSFFFPIQLDPTALAKCLLEEDVGSALISLKMALESIAVAKPAFDAVIAKATEHLPGQPPSGSQNSAPAAPSVKTSAG